MEGKDMEKWKSRLLWGGGAILVLGLLYIIINFIFLDFLVNLWWYDSLALTGYYVRRLFYRYVLFIFFFLFYFFIFFSNFLTASRYLGHSSAAACKPENGGKLKRFKEMALMFQSGALKVYTPLSVILAIPFALPFYHKWEEMLLAISGVSSGVPDVTYGKDISYYLFSYPVCVFMQKNLIIICVILIIALSVLYLIERRLLCKDEQKLPQGVKTHLTALLIIIVLLQTWGFWLQRIELLYVNDHMARFPGPGFIEMWIDYPMIYVTAVTFLATTLLFILFLYKRKGTILIASLICAIFLLMAQGVRNTTVIHELVDDYYVQPDESVVEQKYIKSSIQSTLNAYGLDKVKTQNYSIDESPDFIRDPGVKQSLSNVPVWDQELLDDVYTQFQGFRTYYVFRSADVDRYTINGIQQQVHLAAREISLRDLPEAARNWNNAHMQYTHGYGIVMTPAAQDGDGEMKWYVNDLPLRSEHISVREPRIYYGEEKLDWVIVPNNLGEIDHPKENTNDLVNYEGRGGIPLGFLRRVLFSFYYRDRNFLFTSNTDSKSRLLIRRNIMEAIQTITPFFILDNDPYMAATSNGLFWIVDAYVTSQMYPNAESYQAAYGDAFYKHNFNYIRNSVKIVVDAYHGEISYYITDPNDPIARTYQRIYPGLLKDMSQMPAEIKPHIRYPKAIFQVQLRMYSRYHQTDPNQFYQNEDIWEFARTVSAPMMPYYLSLNLKDKQGFFLINPMSPVGRNNLRSLIVVGCDDDDYGSITVYSFPRGKPVTGPSQVIQSVRTEGEIINELNIWNQSDSEVRFGRIIILPVARNLLYVQPIYLMAKNQAIPRLKRIMVSQGTQFVMDNTLLGALQKLEIKLMGSTGGHGVEGLIQPHQPQGHDLHTEPVHQPQPHEIHPQPVTQPGVPEAHPQPVTQPGESEAHPQPVTQPGVPEAHPQPVTQPGVPEAHPQTVTQPGEPEAHPQTVTQPGEPEAHPQTVTQPGEPEAHPDPFTQPKELEIHPEPVTQPGESETPPEPAAQPDGHGEVHHSE
jgi:hypothetical protein